MLARNLMCRFVTSSFFRSLVNNLRNRLLTVQSSNVSPKGNNVPAASYDEMVTWTKVLSPDNWPEFPSITESIKPRLGLNSI